MDQPYWCTCVVHQYGGFQTKDVTELKGRKPVADPGEGPGHPPFFSEIGHFL